MRLDGGTFDWDYINAISASKSSKSNKNKIEENSKNEKDSKSDCSDSTQKVNLDSSKSTACESILRGEIRLSCELGDLSEYKRLMRNSRNKPIITLEFKNKLRISNDSNNMAETT